jgi:hypothetical protein
MSTSAALDFQWSTVGSFPPTVSSAGCGLGQGRAIVGGGNAGGELLRTTYFFDADTHSFSTGPSLLVPRYGHRFLLGRGDRVVAVGGSGKHWIKTQAPPSEKVYEASLPAEYLDPGDTAWRPADRLNMPCLNWCACTHLDEDVVLVAGGRVDERPTRRAWLISLSSLTVIDQLEMPRARDNDDAVYLPGPGEIILTGGEPSGRFERWERGVGRWSETQEHGDLRAELRLARVNDHEALAIGGGLAEADVDDVVLRWSRGAWVREGAPALPIGRRATVTGIGPASFLVVGTTGADDNASTAQVYEDSSRKWVGVGAPSESRWGHVSLHLGSQRVLVFGGLDCRTAELGRPAG